MPNTDIIRFLDLLYEETREFLISCSITHDIELENSTIHNLQMSFLLNVYNRANNTNLKRINLKNKHNCLASKRNSETNTWIFYRDTYKIEMDKRKNKIIYEDENLLLTSKVIVLENKVKDLEEENKKLKIKNDYYFDIIQKTGYKW